MADPAVKIVSLTVTEGGYYIDPATGGFDAGHADMQHDAANPGRPRSAFGAMVAALSARRAAGHGPFLLSLGSVSNKWRNKRQINVSALMIYEE